MGSGNREGDLGSDAFCQSWFVEPSFQTCLACWRTSYADYGNPLGTFPGLLATQDRTFRGAENGDES